jgi:hypothetical protein
MAVRVLMEERAYDPEILRESSSWERKLIGRITLASTRRSRIIPDFRERRSSESTQAVNRTQGIVNHCLIPYVVM